MRNPEQFWLRILENVAQQSHCKRNSIGALLLNDGWESMSAFGYNGNVRGGPNTCDRDGEGVCGCVHAEINCLIKPRIGTATTMFVTETPCYNCAKLIVNAGILAVYAARPYRDAAGMHLLRSLRVTVTILNGAVS